MSPPESLADPSPVKKWFIEEISRLGRWAHHPSCECYASHLLRLGRAHYCLGCTCLVLGITCTSLLAAADHALLLGVFEPFALWELIGFGVACFLPTLAQPFVQRKPYKVASRFLLGAAIALLCYGALLKLPWSGVGLFLRAVFVVVFVCTYKCTQRLRHAFTPRPCDSCPRGRFPFCAGNAARGCGPIADAEGTIIAFGRAVCWFCRGGC